MHRVKLDNEHDRAPERQLERWEHMHSYVLEEGQKFVFTAEDFHNVRSCKFGRRLADLILRWLQLLVWPTSPEEVTPPLGITWVEMTVSFMLSAQTTIPVLSHQESQGFTERTNTFRNILMHNQFLVNKSIFPDVKPLKVKSLYQLGAKVMKQGLPIRPKLPLQTETLELLQGYFATHGQLGKACFVATPHIPLMDPLVGSELTAADEFNQKQREKLYRERHQNIRSTNGNQDLDGGDEWNCQNGRKLVSEIPLSYLGPIACENHGNKPDQDCGFCIDDSNKVTCLHYVVVF